MLITKEKENNPGRIFISGNNSKRISMSPSYRNKNISQLSQNIQQENLRKLKDNSSEKGSYKNVVNLLPY